MAPDELQRLLLSQPLHQQNLLCTYDSEKYRFSTSNNDDIDNPEPPMNNGVNAFLKLHLNFDVSAIHIQVD